MKPNLPSIPAPRLPADLIVNGQRELSVPAYPAYSLLPRPIKIVQPAFFPPIDGKQTPVPIDFGQR